MAAISFGFRVKSLGLERGTKALIWVMDIARFSLDTMLRRLWSVRGGPRPVVNTQIKYEWDYLYGALEVTGGEAKFSHVPQVNLECDAIEMTDLAATDPEAVHDLIHDPFGFHLRDGDPCLPPTSALWLCPLKSRTQPLRTALVQDQ